jgi:hypothetical protein
MRCSRRFVPGRIQCNGPLIVRVYAFHIGRGNWEYVSEQVCGPLGRFLEATVRDVVTPRASTFP